MKHKTDIRCYKCDEVVAGMFEPTYNDLDPANTLCYPCAMAEVGL